MNEKTINQLVSKRLIKSFHIEYEANGISQIDHKTRRIDAIITPINKQEWANPNIRFGIEFKGFGVSEIQVYEQMKQCIDYSYCKFNGEYLPILICPPIEQITKRYDLISYTFMMKFLNAFNIGEIKTAHSGALEIVFSSTHKIWNEFEGVKEGNRWKFEKKFGGER